jgi:hypothetical protein
VANRIRSRAQAASPDTESKAPAAAYAAGRLAITYGLVPWTEKELLQAILCCQLDGLRYSQTKNQQADTSVAGLRGKLVRYLADNRDQFKNMDENMPAMGTHEFGSVRGYCATFKGEKWLYLHADQLKTIIGSGKNADQLKADLVADGLLNQASNGKYLIQRPVFAAKGNKGYRWVHAFRAKILQDRDHD